MNNNNSSVSLRSKAICTDLSMLNSLTMDPVSLCLNTNNPDEINSKITRSLIMTFNIWALNAQSSQLNKKKLMRAIKKLYFRKNDNPKIKNEIILQKEKIKAIIRDNFETVKEYFPKDLVLLNKAGAKSFCNSLFLDIATDCFKTKPNTPSKAKRKIRYVLKGSLGIALEMMSTLVHHQLLDKKIPIIDLSKKIIPHSLFYSKKSVSSLSAGEIDSIIDSFEFWAKSPILLNHYSGHAALLVKSITKLYLQSSGPFQKSIRKRIAKLYDEHCAVWNDYLPIDILIGGDNGKYATTSFLKLILEVPYIELSIEKENSSIFQYIIKHYPRENDQFLFIPIEGICGNAVESCANLLNERSTESINKLSNVELLDFISLVDFLYFGLDNAPEPIKHVLLDKSKYSEDPLDLLTCYFIFNNYGNIKQASSCYENLVKQLNTPQKIQGFEDELLQPNNSSLLLLMNAGGMFTKIYQDALMLDEIYPLEEAVELYLRGLIENKQWTKVALKSIFHKLTKQEAQAYLLQPNSHPAFELGLTEQEISAYCTKFLS